MTPEEVAREIVAGLWTAAHRAAVLTTTLRCRGGRAEGRRSVPDRLTRVAGEVVRGLQSGALSVEAGRAAGAEARLVGGLHVAATAEEMTALVAAALRAGDNAWVDCSPDAPPGAPVLYLRSRADPSHPRLA